MSEWKRVLKVALATITTLALLIATLTVLHSGPRPVCQKAVDGAFQQWMLETGHTNTYPNAEGMGSNSLAMIQPYVGSEVQRYRYVPGLRDDDPKSLVLMYLRTRYTWHGDSHHTLLSPERWLVISPEIIESGTCPEGGELVDTQELKKRLAETVAFLRAHQRPYCQVVAKEQSAFLNSVRD